MLEEDIIEEIWGVTKTSDVRNLQRLLVNTYSTLPLAQRLAKMMDDPTFALGLLTPVKTV